MIRCVSNISSSKRRLRYLCVPRGCPITRQARRSDTCNASIACCTAFRLLSGATIFFQALLSESRYPAKDLQPISSAADSLSPVLSASWPALYPSPHILCATDIRFILISQSTYRLLRLCASEGGYVLMINRDNYILPKGFLHNLYTEGRKEKLVYIVSVN